MARRCWSLATSLGLLLLFSGGAVYAQTTGQLADHQTGITQASLDEFITLFRYFLYIAGFLVAVLAALGVGFFGFDVRNAHGAIKEDADKLRALIDASIKLQNESEGKVRDLLDKASNSVNQAEAKNRELLDKARDSVVQAEAKNRELLDKARDSVNQTDAKGRELLDKARASLDATENLRREHLRRLEEFALAQQIAFEKKMLDFFEGAQKRVEERLREIQEQVEESGATMQELSEKQDPNTQFTKSGRSDDELIRDIIRTSKFKWTTLGRIMSKTGLSENQLLPLARAMPDIEIGKGNESGKPIFRLK
jgi:hypothetical protein